VPMEGKKRKLWSKGSYMGYFWGYVV
jgi:hypothetical protein